MIHILIAVSVFLCFFAAALSNERFLWAQITGDMRNRQRSKQTLISNVTESDNFLFSFLTRNLVFLKNEGMLNSYVIQLIF